jgi:tetratricopeptide (TPR) repeat protein
MEMLPMLAPLSSLEAYRRDAITIDGDGVDDATAASWLESATRLERAAAARGPERDRLLAGLLSQLGVVPFPATVVSAETLASTVGAVATAMEDQTFFRLSNNLLTSLLLIVPDEQVLIRGRIVAHQARLARNLGDLAHSKHCYELVEQMGAEHGLPELTARAWNGYGVLAHTRGDYPESRRRYQSVVELKGAADDSLCDAHHQLMIAAAAAKDYDLAACHAWKAFEGASTPRRETDALINLAQLLLLAGHARPALRGFAAALARKPMPRFELATLGGAACAAAIALPTKQARALVRNFSERVDALVSNLNNGSSLPWASASALVEMSEALAQVGDHARASLTAQRAEKLASANGLHELLHRLENPPVIQAPVVFSAESSAILTAVDELEGAELVGASA